MAQFAVSPPNIDARPPNAGFLRPNAALAIIVVSDEDDSSFGTTDYYARFFQSAKGKGNESLVSFSAIAGTTPVGCTPPGEESSTASLAEPAFRYARGRDEDRRHHRQHLRRELREHAAADRRGAQHAAPRLPAHAAADRQHAERQGERRRDPQGPGERLAVPRRHEQRGVPGDVHSSARRGDSRWSTRSTNEARAPPSVVLGLAAVELLAHRAHPRVPERLHVRRRPLRVRDRRGLPRRAQLRRGHLRLPQHLVLPRRLRVLERRRELRVPRVEVLPAGSRVAARTSSSAPAALKTAAPTATRSTRTSRPASARPTCAAPTATASCPRRWRASARATAAARSITSYDPISKNCVCAKDECCPPNHKYSGTVRACVCIGDSCCPTGYKKDPNGERCICIDDASCGAGNRCDAATGACKCTSTAGCKSGNFCNALGFCQSIAACTSNADCPAGPVLRHHVEQVPRRRAVHARQPVPVRIEICNAATASCKPGCRKDGDCARRRRASRASAWTSAARTQGCPVNQFCDAMRAAACSDARGRQ